MTTNLTLVAALPGSGAGCMSALPAEKNEQPVKVQMKAAYFEEPKEEPSPKIEPTLVTVIGGGGGWGKAVPPSSVDEMATKLLKAVQGGQ